MSSPVMQMCQEAIGYDQQGNAKEASKMYRLAADELAKSGHPEDAQRAAEYNGRAQQLEDWLKSQGGAQGGSGLKNPLADLKYPKMPQSAFLGAAVFGAIAGTAVAGPVIGAVGMGMAMVAANQDGMAGSAMRGLGNLTNDLGKGVAKAIKDQTSNK